MDARCLGPHPPTGREPSGGGTGDYFDLRAEDSLRKLLQETVVAYQRALQITTNQYQAGTISRADVVTARAQLQAVVAQLAGVGVQRPQFEHAIAMLTGHPPADLSIPFSPLPDAVPVAPVALPSTPCCNAVPTSPPPSARWPRRTR